jgi:hypothetical protein
MESAIAGSYNSHAVFCAVGVTSESAGRAKYSPAITAEIGRQPPDHSGNLLKIRRWALVRRLFLHLSANGLAPVISVIENRGAAGKGTFYAYG